MSATVPAKLVLLKKRLRRLGHDDNLNNYECLGQQWMIQDKRIRDNRLIKNVCNDVIKEVEVPPITKSCVCLQDIKYNCIIRHISTLKVFVIGSCCYQALTLKESRKQMCTVQGCYNRHENRNYTLCNQHKAEHIKQQREKEKHKKAVNKLGNTKFDFGKTYADHLIKDLPLTYIKWVEGWAREAQSNTKQVAKLLQYVDLKKVQA